MGGRAAVRAALATLALVATAACSSSSAEKAGPTATVATEVPTTATTNPYAVPAVINAAYVNRVLAGLDAIMGDVTRLVVRTKTIPPEAYDRLRAVYGNNSLLQLTLDSIQTDIRRGLIGYKADPGNKSSVVMQIISANGKCIFAQVRRDYLAVSDHPTTVNPQWVGLQLSDAIRDSANYNPTGWALVYDGFPQDHSTPTTPCAG